MPLEVHFTDKPRAEFEVTNFPLPEKFGTYALVLTRGEKRQFLATLARVPQPRADGSVDNVPIFGEGVLIDHDGRRADYYARMGVRGWRAEAGWNEKEDGSVDWANFDRLFEAAKKAGCQVLITLGGHPEWTRPFSVPTPAVGWTPKTNGYGGTGDWLCRPELYPRYGRGSSHSSVATGKTARVASGDWRTTTSRGKVAEYRAGRAIARATAICRS